MAEKSTRSFTHGRYLGMPNTFSSDNPILKTHGSSLNDENLRTLITETEAIINSRPLTVETLSDVNSEMLLSPSCFLTMKTDVILPPPGTFETRYLFQKKMATCSAHC